MNIIETLDLAIKQNEKATVEGAYILPYKDGVLKKSTYMTNDEWKAFLKTLGIEGEYEGIGNCIVGYADMEPQEKPRKENRVYYID